MRCTKRGARVVSLSCSVALLCFFAAACATNEKDKARPVELAPDFTALDTDGNTLTLSELVKDRTVVVAFFPKAFTPG